MDIRIDRLVFSTSTEEAHLKEPNDDNDDECDDD